MIYTTNGPRRTFHTLKGGKLPSIYVDLARDKAFGLGHEPLSLGMDAAWGPGYRRATIEHDKALKTCTEKYGAPENLVLVPANQCNPGNYLFGIISPTRIIPVTSELDLIICKTVSDANKLKLHAPEILPIQFTAEINRRSSSEFLIPIERESDVLIDKRTGKLKTNIAKTYGLSEENLLINFGADELISAIFRYLAETGAKRLFVPIPEYFDAIKKAVGYGFKILPGNALTMPFSPLIIERWANKIRDRKPDAIYLSNPNNPFGYVYTIDQLRKIIKATEEKPETVIIIDGTNIVCPETWPEERKKLKFDPLQTTPWVYLQEEFPNARLIFIRSFSKSHLLAAMRIGYAWTTQRSDADALQKFQPKAISKEVERWVNRILEEDPVGTYAIQIARRFHRIMEEQANLEVGKFNLLGDLTISSSSSNLTVVNFTDGILPEIYVEGVRRLKSRRIGKIIGVPYVGAGYLESGNLDGDGLVLPEAVLNLKKGTILGLPPTAVRLSAFNDEAIIGELVATILDRRMVRQHMVCKARQRAKKSSP